MFAVITKVGDYAIEVDTATGIVSIGCQRRTVEEWLREGPEIAKEYGLTVSQAKAYTAAMLFIQHALQYKSQPTTAKKAAKKPAKKKAAKKATKKAVAKKRR